MVKQIKRKNDLEKLLKYRIMRLNVYQKKALETAQYNEKILYPTLGLNGEAGEVAEKVKKVLRDNNGDFDIEKRIEILKECGDCLWYLSSLIHDLGSDMETVARMNIEKLESRKNRGKIGGNGDNR